MNQSYFNHLAHPQLEGQLGKCLDQGLLCTDPVSVGRDAFTDSLPDSHFHSFVYLFSHLLIHSFIHVPTSCSLGYLNAYSSFIHCALHSFTHSFPQPSMQLLTLVSFTHFTNIYRVPAIHHAQCQALGIERGIDSTGLMELQSSREENFGTTVTKSVMGACKRVWPVRNGGLLQARALGLRSERPLLVMH